MRCAGCARFRRLVARPLRSKILEKNSRRARCTPPWPRCLAPRVLGRRPGSIGGPFEAFRRGTRGRPETLKPCKMQQKTWFHKARCIVDFCRPAALLGPPEGPKKPPRGPQDAPSWPLLGCSAAAVEAKRLRKCVAGKLKKPSKRLTKKPGRIARRHLSRSPARD